MKPLVHWPKDLLEQHPEDLRDLTPSRTPEIAVALLTAGRDKHYVYGLASSLAPKGAVLDLIGSDELDCPEITDTLRLRFLNLRGSTLRGASLLKRISRVLVYYAKLIRYAATAKPLIFHILWNNKFEYLDRTLLMLYYRFLGKRIVFTAHNVNADRRDSKDTPLNRLTLRIQYRLVDRIFVHTEKMKRELVEEFAVQGDRIALIPYGINNSVPNTPLTSAEAKHRLGIRDGEKTLLFFGNIAPYKGLDYLITAFRQILAGRDNYRLIIAGKPKNCEKYWETIRESITDFTATGRVLLRGDFIPDEETEVYFKAADLLVLPYTHIYQSGVLFLGHSFGLPVVAADVGSLKDEIVEGKTGFMFRPEDPIDLAKAVERYFASDLYAHLNCRRQEIQDYATERHSWDLVGQTTMSVYAALLRTPFAGESCSFDSGSRIAPVCQPNKKS